MSFGCADKPEGLISYMPRDLKEIRFFYQAFRCLKCQWPGFGP